jgi:SRSO17 transposase
MDRRFAKRKKEMLAECEGTEQALDGMLARLQEFAQPFVDLLSTESQGKYARIYLSGLTSNLERKNAESIAYREGLHRRCIQDFVSEKTWDHEPQFDELARQIGREIGEEDGVLVFDPSGFPKKGTESVGVQRQWCGRLGKKDNCQVGVYLGYASRKDYALVSTRLYLPAGWASNKSRRKKCGVPTNVCFQTRHDLALNMLHEEARHLPHRWIAGDDEMGRSSKFRRDLRGLKEQYVLAVPSNTTIRDLLYDPPEWNGRGAKPKRKFEQVQKWVQPLDDGAWTKIEVRDAEKGPLVIEIVKTLVQTHGEGNRVEKDEEVLILVRSTDEQGNVKHDYYLSNAPYDTPLEEFARVIKAEHRIEDSLKIAKSETGLAHYEVRSWSGWHHHQALSLIAAWFLIVETRRGKKIHAGPDSAAGSRCAGDLLVPCQQRRRSAARGVERQETIAA